MLTPCCSVDLTVRVRDTNTQAATQIEAQPTYNAFFLSATDTVGVNTAAVGEDVGALARLAGGCCEVELDTPDTLATIEL